MELLKYIARKILSTQIADLEKERDLYQSWCKHHQSTIKSDRLKLVNRVEWDKLVDSTDSIAAMRKYLEKKGTIR